ncbi:MAG: hypothetical protein GY729_13095 [Desulfobacteraceae bacterium]|nr:hypothetical protein [Desulfobacteraceae bacterium]
MEPETDEYLFYDFVPFFWDSKKRKLFRVERHDLVEIKDPGAIFSVLWNSNRISKERAYELADR